jgi:FixJ family two-component response regulator
MNLLHMDLTRLTAVDRRSAELPVVFVVDSDPLVRETLDVLIRSAGWEVRTAATAQEFLASPRVTAPHCVLVELDLPGASGLELQREICDRRELAVLFMSARPDIPAAVQAMKAGALEFLTKPLVEAMLLDAIGHALERSRAELRKQAQSQALHARYELLSRREREVMSLVVSGRPNKQVGCELGISEITVKAHRGKLMRKMRASSLPELVNMAARLTRSGMTRSGTVALYAR